jgi:quercetin dioxygenase-like cupin family protein
MIGGYTAGQIFRKRTNKAVAENPEVQVIPWPEGSLPDENQLRRILGRENLSAYGWGNAPGDTYPAHRHSYHKVIYVVQGSIVFGLPELDRRVALQPGDRLELPAGTLHNAVVGPSGVRCLEAHRHG